MKLAPRYRLIMTIQIMLLVSATTWLAILYSSPAKPLVFLHQQPLVERTTKAAAEIFRHSIDDQRRNTFPIVMKLADRTCVELRSTARDQGANFIACYSKSGNVIEEHATTGF